MKKRILIDEFTFIGGYFIAWFILNQEQYPRKVKINEKFLVDYLDECGILSDKLYND